MPIDLDDETVIRGWKKTYRVAQIGQCSKCWEYEDLIEELRAELAAKEIIITASLRMQDSWKKEALLLREECARLKSPKAYNCAGCGKTIYLLEEVAQAVDYKPYCETCGLG